MHTRSLIPLLSLPGLLSCATAELDSGHPVARGRPAPDAESGAARAGAPPPPTTGPTLGDEQELAGSDTTAGDRFGSDVAAAGDVDGDGYPDLVVGAYSKTVGPSSPGGAYVYYGSASGLSSGDETVLEPPAGSAADEFGHRVTGAGDLDGDGYDDVVVGAYRDRTTASYAGAAYVYFGSSSGTSTSVWQQLTASDGLLNDNFGQAVAGGADLDGDGYDDLAVGAPGEGVRGAVYLYFGSSSGPTSASEQKITTAAYSERFGHSLDISGDLNGDGYRDMVAGDFRTEAAFVMYGSSTGVDTATEQELNGDDWLEYFGTAVASGGDLDGDGFDDLVVGANRHDRGLGLEGKAYVYYGSSTGVVEATRHTLVQSPRTRGARFGSAVDIIGDTDGDGYDDLLVGAPGSSSSSSYRGAAYLFFGSASGVVSSSVETLTASDGATNDRFGSAVAGLGDVEGDGAVHVAVAAYMDDDVGADAGAVYLYGGPCVTDSDSDGYCDDVDCDRFDATVNPGATETVGDGVDADCDGMEICYVDGDDDGYLVDTTTTVVSADADCTDAGEGQAADPTGDCDDADADAYPGAPDTVGDSVDSDCDGVETCYVDGDDDGHLVDTTATVASADTDCADTGEGQASDPTGDCDDADADAHPGAAETVGDEVDQDCDGAETCYADADADGFTDGSTVASADEDCADAGEATDGAPDGDCDDADATRNPGAIESVGDGVDTDCDGGEVCYADADGDGYTDGSAVVVSADSDCADDGEATAGAPTGECDDGDAEIHPGATETVGDGVDSDCDGLELCYADADLDGFVDAGRTRVSADADCADPGEGDDRAPTGDCDDSDASIHPAATERPGDGVDQDCDGTEVCYADADADGYPDLDATVDSEDADCSDPGEGTDRAPEPDCDDADATIHPGAEEGVADGIDQDCDGAELCYADADADGYLGGTAEDPRTVSSDDDDCDDPGEGSAADPTGDCDDGDPTVGPAATELVGDGVDQDCDGGEICYVDADGDGYPDFEATVDSADTDCGDAGEGRADQPPGECDDGDAAVHPDAEEVADDGVDQDCDGEDLAGPVAGDGPAGKGRCSAVPARTGLAWLAIVGILGTIRRRRRPGEPRGSGRPAVPEAPTPGPNSSQPMRAPVGIAP